VEYNATNLYYFSYFPLHQYLLYLKFMNFTSKVNQMYIVTLVWTHTAHLTIVLNSKAILKLLKSAFSLKGACIAQEMATVKRDNLCAIVVLLNMEVSARKTNQSL
jgi:hypothetical protein